MELYNELASNDEKKRMSAAEQVVKKIVAARQSGIAEKGFDFEYALGRLVKGLSSGRESARLGFSIALTELLYELQDIEASSVLDMIETHSTPSGNISGMEERDFYFGRLFGLTAVITSKILGRTNIQSATITRVIDDLTDLALKKPWLREPATKALCTLVTILPDTDTEGIKACAEHIYQSLEKGGLVRSQDGAAVVLTLRSLPSTVRPKISAKIWQHADPLHPANLPLLSKVLREVQSDDASVKATGGFKKEPHFIWGSILQRYVDKTKDTVPFKSLWETVVENGLFSGNPSLERKYLGYQLFLVLLPLPEDLVGDLFTPNFLRSLVNNAASGDRYLNKAAKKSLTIIHSTCEARPSTIVPIYKALVGYSTQFDRLSKTKTLDSLTTNLTPSTLTDLLTFLTSKILAEAEPERPWHADQLVHLLRQPNLPPEPFHQTLQFLCRYGFFTSPTLTKKDQQILREKLFSLLALRIGDMSEVWPSLAVLEIEGLEAEHKKVMKLDSEIKKIRRKAIKRVKKLRLKREEEGSEQVRGLEMLFSLTLLQLYNGDAEAVSVLEELDGVKVEENSGLLVEVILGFLAKPSVLLRKLSEQVFGSFAESLSAEGLQLLLDVLLTPETVSGAEELFDHEMEDADQEEEDEDEEDDHDHEEDDQEEEEDEDEDVEMSENDEPDEELDAALSAALGTQKPLLPNGTTDHEEDSTDEELMNDDEMMALDSSLATIFRQRLKSTTKTKQQKEQKHQISVFKCKVLDLVEILFKHPTPLALSTLLPLLQVLRITKSDEVHAKTLTALRKLSKHKDVPDYPEWAGLMRKIHRDAERARGRDGTIHSQLSILLARIARRRGEEEEVVGVYAETMKGWVKNGRSMVRAGLFADWLNWCQSIRRPN